MTRKDKVKYLIKSEIESDDWCPSKIKMFLTELDIPLHLDDNKVDEMIRVSSAICGTTPDKVKSKSRREEDVLARSMVFKFLRDVHHLSLEQTASFMGRHHTAVIHSVRKVNQDIAHNYKGSKDKYYKFHNYFLYD